MEIRIILLITITILLILFLVLIAKIKRKNKIPPDYYMFFVLGILWTVAGIPLENYALSAMGMVFMILGLTNKSKWKENRRDWNKMKKDEKKALTIAFIGLAVVIFMGVITYFLTAKGII